MHAKLKNSEEKQERVLSHQSKRISKDIKINNFSQR
jgi:hypothetical protein